MYDERCYLCTAIYFIIESTLGHNIAKASLFINIASILWALNTSAVKDEAGNPIAPDTLETVRARLAVGVVQNPVNPDLNLDRTLGSGSMFGVWLNQTSRTCPCSSSR